MGNTIDKFGHEITFGLGSSTGHPDYKGMQTSDIQLWIKLDEKDWFRPYGRFGRVQILQMLNLCKKEFEVISLMELLSAKRLDTDGIKPRESVVWFAKQMEFKLQKNDHKGGWERCNHSTLIHMLKSEVSELEFALCDLDNPDDIIKECADIANFSMMIADVCGKTHGKFPNKILCKCGLAADGTLYGEPMCEGCLHRNT